MSCGRVLTRSSSLLRLAVAAGALHLINITTPLQTTTLFHQIQRCRFRSLSNSVPTSNWQLLSEFSHHIYAAALSLPLHITHRIMAPHRGNNRRNNHLNQRQQHKRQSSTNFVQPSDYESELPTDYYPSDANNHNHSTEAMAPTTSVVKDTRTNEELNLGVLKRYNPQISTILSLAPYAVVYLFNTSTQQWEKEKVGIEGTLFVCELTPGELGEERYSVFVLNRRGMQNFETRLHDGDDVQLSDPYVILRVDGKDDSNHIEGVQADGQQSIYGLWIFSEPAPSSTAETRDLNSRIIKECAIHGGQSRKIAEERQAQSQKYEVQHEQAAAQGGVPMGRQISLHELFGQQRAQDDEWSVKVHSPATQAAPTAPGGNQNGAGNDVLGNLFRKAVAHQGPR